MRFLLIRADVEQVFDLAELTVTADDVSKQVPSDPDPAFTFEITTGSLAVPLVTEALLASPLYVATQ